jgi:hypothetical protein
MTQKDIATVEELEAFLGQYGVVVINFHAT